MGGSVVPAVQGLGGPEGKAELALRLVEKGVVSISLAARIAGMTYKDFVEYAIKRKAKIFYADESDLTGEP